MYIYTYTHKTFIYIHIALSLSLNYMYIHICKRYKLQASMRFDIALYTHDGALTCARYWALKHHRWHDIWLFEGSPAEYTFAEEDLSEFPEPEAFTKLVESCDAVKAQRRFHILRSLKPIGSGV